MAGKTSSAPTVGIDIGSSLIKVVEAKAVKGKMQITALGVAPTPPGTIDNEMIVDPQALGDAVKKLLQESGITCKRSVSSVAGQSSVIVRIIEVPKMTRQELAETMKWEVERHVPFSADEVVMDFQPIERPNASPDDQNMEVLLAVAQQDLVNRHVETLFAAGLQPVAIDVEPLAASRALIDAAGNGAAEQTVAIVNIGAASTELGVYQNGILAFPRTIPIAGDAITRAISDTLNISVPDAERLKRERAVVLVDRATQYMASAGVGGVDAMGGYGEPGSTMGMPAADESGGDADLGFIPGLGYGPMMPEEETQSPGLPDFDIDIGGSGAEPPKPVMNFDLGGDESFAAPPTPQLDLSSAPAEGDSQSSLVPSEASDQGMPEFTEEQVFDAMIPVLSDLVAEIRRSLEYYASRFQSQPDKVIVCGGTAKMEGLAELFQMELGLPTEVGNPLQKVTVFSRSLSQEYLADVAMIFPVSVGLAIRDMIGE